MIKFLSVVLLLLLSLGQVPSAGAASPAPPAPLSGQWKGPLKVLGGEITLVITIVPLSNGTYYAALDAPRQRISRMPVEVALKGTDLTLRIEQAGSHFEGKVLDNGAQLSGTWTQPGLTAPLVLTRAVASAQAAHRLRAAPPYRETDVTFLNPATRQRLSGTLTVPAGEGPFPAVALLSDLGPQNRDAEVSGYRMFGQVADFLTRRGVAVLRFDDRGVDRSAGTYATATTADLVTDAQAAMAFLRTQPLVSAQRVGLLGHGEGANVALLAAAAPGRGPAFVVSLAGYGQPGYEVLLRQQGEIMRLIGADPSQVKSAQEAFERTVVLVRQTANNAVARAKVTALLSSSNTGLDANMARARAAQLTSPWSRYFFDFNPLTRLGQVQCPVLLLNGTDDLQVSARQNMTPLQKTLHAANRPVTAQRLAGVNHLFQAPTDQWTVVDGAQVPTFSPEALKTVREWVALQTKLPGTPLPVTVKRAAPRKSGSAHRARG